MATLAGAPATSFLGIESTSINTAPGVTLDEKQKALVGSVLDVHLDSLFPISLPAWWDSE